MQGLDQISWIVDVKINLQQSYWKALFLQEWVIVVYGCSGIFPQARMAQGPWRLPLGIEQGPLGEWGRGG